MNPITTLDQFRRRRGQSATRARALPTMPMAHVAVIDDEIEIISVLRDALVDEHCQVSGWTSPPPVEEIARTAPDAIILDLIFNGRDLGRQLLDDLARCPATATIPVIVCSARRGGAPDAGHHHIDAFVPKPFDLDMILAAVRTATRLRRASLPWQPGIAVRAGVHDA